MLQAVFNFLLLLLMAAKSLLEKLLVLVKLLLMLVRLLPLFKLSKEVMLLPPKKLSLVVMLWPVLVGEDGVRAGSGYPARQDIHNLYINYGLSENIYIWGYCLFF